MLFSLALFPGRRLQVGIGRIIQAGGHRVPDRLDQARHAVHVMAIDRDRGMDLDPDGARLGEKGMLGHELVAADDGNRDDGDPGLQGQVEPSPPEPLKTAVECSSSRFPSRSSS